MIFTRSCQDPNTISKISMEGRPGKSLIEFFSAKSNSGDKNRFAITEHQKFQKKMFLGYLRNAVNSVLSWKDGCNDIVGRQIPCVLVGTKCDLDGFPEDNYQHFIDMCGFKQGC